MRPCSEAEVRALLPIQAYSQKQLSDVSVRTDELARFVTAPIRTELAQLDRRISEKSERIRQTYANRRRHQVLANDIARRSLEARSLQEQVDAIRNSLTGLSEEDRNLINQGKSYDSAEEAVAGWLSDLRSVADGLSDLSTEVSTSLAQAQPAPDQPEQAVLAAAQGEYAALMGRTQKSIDAMLLDLRRPEHGEEGSIWAEWQQKLDSFREAYQA